MARLSDFDPRMAAALERLPLPEFDSTPWVEAPPLAEARVALISTAGIHRSGDLAFQGGAADYRIIPGDVDLAEVAMTHVSVNFDRSGFQQDTEVVFPLGRLRDLAEAGEVGSVAQWHYSFMGATDPSRMVESGHEVGRLLRENAVTAALLVPV